MHSFKSLLLAVLLVVSVSSTYCQQEISDPGAKRVCASVKDAEAPAADRPTAAEEKSLAKCSSLDAYYGFGGEADPVKARKCAFAEVDRNDKAVLSGKAILTMVYANGKGVQKNYDVALHLACTIGDSPGDAAGRVMELERLRKGNYARATFGFCDHSSGRELYEQCAILTERFDKIDRVKKFDELIAHWSPADKKAFITFMEEADRFVQVQAANGVDLAGSFEVQEQVFIRNGLLEALQKLERGELPESSADDFKHAEAAERETYDRTQNGSTTRWGTISGESVRKSEDEWHRYVNAWIAFGKIKYPKVSEQSWKTWLDQERVVSFNRFLH